MANPLIVRRGGLPLNSLDRLRFEQSFAAATEIVRSRDRLVAEGTTLADALYSVIGELADAAGKPGLVGLRRALHSMRPPAAKEWNDTTCSALPSEIAARVSAWVTDLRRHERERAGLADVLAAERCEKQEVLRYESAQHGFRRALSQASATLYAELDKWLADPQHRPREQVMVRLVKYMSRAAMKTSPYSTFTVTGAGTWTEAGAAAHFTNASVAGVVELDGFLLRQLSGLLCEDPRLAPFLTVRVNPSATVSDNRVTFTGPSPREPIVTMPVNAAVRACLEILSEHPPTSFTELHERLSDGADPAVVRLFLGALLDAGLLERQLPFTDQELDPLEVLCDWTTTVGGDDFTHIVSLLQRVRRALRASVPVPDVEAQVARQNELKQAVIDLGTGLGLPLDHTQRQGSFMFRENAVFTSPVVECSTAHWQPALDDLDVVRRWMAPFDLALPLRIVLGTFVGERFGQGARVPLLAVHRAVQESVAAGPSSSMSDAEQEIVRFLSSSPLDQMTGDAHSPVARLRQLNRVRAQARGALLSGTRAPTATQVDPVLLSEMIATWPLWIAAPRSLACYVQLLPGEEMGLVLNSAHTGHGRGRSRSLQLIKDAGGTTPPLAIEHNAVGTPVDAELGGLAVSALNRRVASLPYEIDYPLAVSGRPAEERITLGELLVVHDPESQLVRLFSPALGRDVRSLHVGMMSDFLLPPVARLLTQAFGATHYVHPSIPLVATHSDLTTPAGIVHHPRITVGRVVVQRERWVVPITEVPVREKGESADSHLLRLVDWLHTTSIPAQCFVRVWTGLSTSHELGPNGWENWVFDKSRKPVYVDFANWYLVMAFDKMLRDSAQAVVFEEVLPSHAGASATGQDDRRATEFLVELTGQVDHDA
ncbi:lantibiotic dehydratase [Actinokineospora cianjurensis]|uniref:lantibiotic dehydratase n=1 Tax=Actinokineospora cianjurensis TaxID=585224 RepID=UPI0014778188|nr:lantibiotic dehydratase [Actinokineospora cianjurensis]